MKTRKRPDGFTIFTFTVMFSKCVYVRVNKLLSVVLEYIIDLWEGCIAYITALHNK